MANLDEIMSGLSIESCDGDGDDADEECSEEKDGHQHVLQELSLNSDDEIINCSYSLPSTPRHHRLSNRKKHLMSPFKDYASDNDAKKRSRWPRFRANKKKTSTDTNVACQNDIYSNGFNGLVVLTRPKGGERSLYMGMEEVKACNDLGFELEHERMFDMPSGVSLSAAASTIDTASSGGNSPMGSWRISSPGDDPRDVKARLKVWAQAVAVTSTSRYIS